MPQYIDRLAMILEEQKAISPPMAASLKKEFAHRSKDAVDDFLLTEGIVDRPALLAALNSYYKVPAFDAEGYFFDHQLLLQFPKDFLLRNQIIPVAVYAGDNILLVVADDPSNEELLEKIGQFVSYDITFAVGIAQDITDAVKEFYDESLTVTDDYEYVDAEEREEKRDLEIAKRIIDKMQ